MQHLTQDQKQMAIEALRGDKKGNISDDKVAGLIGVLGGTQTLADFQKIADRHVPRPIDLKNGQELLEKINQEYDIKKYNLANGQDADIFQYRKLKEFQLT